jgi:hypothetical protein
VSVCRQSIVVCGRRTEDLCRDNSCAARHGELDAQRLRSFTTEHNKRGCVQRKVADNYGIVGVADNKIEVFHPDCTHGQDAKTL